MVVNQAPPPTTAPQTQHQPTPQQQPQQQPALADPSTLFVDEQVNEQIAAQREREQQEKQRTPGACWSEISMVEDSADKALEGNLLAAATVPFGSALLSLAVWSASSPTASRSACRAAPAASLVKKRGKNLGLILIAGS